MTILTFDSALAGRTDLTQYGSNARLLFALEIRTDIEDIHSVAATALTDGSDDKKCDLIYVSRDDGLLIVGQGYENRASSNRPTEASSNKADDLNTAATWLLSRHIDDLPARIKSAAQDVRSALSSGEIRTIQFWYVHNLPESQNVRQALRTVEETVKNNVRQSFPEIDVEEISALEIGQERLEDWYRAIESPILVNDELEIDIPGGYQLQGSNWSAFVTAVPARRLRELHQTYKSNLFSANIRDYLGSRQSDKNINNGIKRTAQTQPQEFWVFNNGITALVHSFTHQPSDGKLIINGLSVVNGAQTTGALGTLDNQPSSNAMVPARFVMCDDRQTITDIIRYNNSQNSIKAADFRSNDSIQQRLREEFQSIPGATYSGGRRGSPNATIDRDPYRLPAETCAQSLLAFHGDPVTAYYRRTRIWEVDSLYSRCFNDDVTALHAVFVYSLVKAIEALKTRLVDQQSEFGVLPEDMEAQLTFLRKRGSIFVLTNAISKSLEVILNRSLPNKFRVSFAANKSPDQGKAIWGPIIDATMPFSLQLNSAVDPTLSNNNVSSATELFARSVRSVAAINAPIYQGFAQEIRIRT